YCEPEPFGDLAGLTSIFGGLGGSKGLGGPGDSIGGLAGKGGASSLGIFDTFLGMIWKKNFVLQAVKKFKFLYTFLNMTNKLGDMIGLKEYKCNFKSCTGLAYCFGLTREFQVNMSLCAEDRETTTEDPNC
ncbi:hypothetical protein Avbf_14769, partial [Armadillidium vulgare]